MSLSAREQDALDSIQGELAYSDPTLVTLLTTFTRLTADETIPARGTVRARPRRAIANGPRKQRRCRQTGARRNPGRAHRRLGSPQAMGLLWVLTTVAFIAVALVLSHGGQGPGTQACTGSWPTFCSSAGNG
jgi:hypothetical protein